MKGAPSRRVKGSETMEDLEEAFFFRDTIIGEKGGTLNQVLAIGMTEEVIRKSDGEGSITIIHWVGWVREDKIEARGVATVEGDSSWVKDGRDQGGVKTNPFPIV